MYFVELIVQGLRQFSELRRLRFQQGYNTVLSPVDGRSDVLLKALHALFYNSAMDSRRPDLVEPGAQSCRLGLTMVGRDGKTYRLLRDFVSGAVSLSVDDEGQGQHRPLANSAQTVAQLLGAQVGWPAEDVFSSLQSCSLKDMPSRQAPTLINAPVPATQPGMTQLGMMQPGMTQPGMMQLGMMQPGMMQPGTMQPGMMQPSMTQPGTMQPGMMPQGQFAAPGQNLGAWQEGQLPGSPGMSMSANATMQRQVEDPYPYLDTEQKTAKLAELKNLLKNSAAVKNLEFELDGLQRRKFELDDLMRPLRDSQKLVEEARDKLRPFSDLQDIPFGFLEKMAWFVQQKETRDSKLQGLEDLHKKELAKLRTAPVLPLTKDPVFLASAGIGGLSLVLGIVLARSVDPSLWLIALIDIPALAVTAWSLLQRISENERSGRGDRIDRRHQDRCSKIISRFELNTSDVRKVLARHQVQPDDKNALETLEIQLNQRAEIQQLIEKREAELKTLAATWDTDPKQVQTEYDSLSSQLDIIEEKLASSGGVTVDEQELRQHIQALETILGVQSVAPANPTEPQALAQAGLAAHPDAIPRAPAPMDPANMATMGPGSQQANIHSSNMDTLGPLVHKSTTQSAPLSPRSSATPPMGTPITQGHASPQAQEEDPSAGYASIYGNSSDDEPQNGGGGSSQLSSVMDSASAMYCGDGRDDGYGAMNGVSAANYNSGETNSASASSQIVTDETRRIMTIASELFGSSIEALGERISVRLGQYVSAFTDQRFQAVKFDSRGGLQFVEAQSERAVPYLMLAPSERDVAYFALKFVIIESYAEIHPIPAILDDPFAVLADLKHPLALKMMQFLGSKTQVIHFTSLSALADDNARIDL